MKLSARTRYAARILLELAKHGDVGPLAAAKLSQGTGVSVQFIEQILKDLKQAGLTRSTRGAGGGHMLAQPASAITLGEIVSVMEGGINLTTCSAEEAVACPRKNHCATRKVWIRASRVLEHELDSTTLQDLMDQSNMAALPDMGTPFGCVRAPKAANTQVN